MPRILYIGLGKECKKGEREWNRDGIPVAEQLPQVETEVYVTARRKYRDGTYREIVTIAMYEDGTVLENDSCWNWNEINGEWDEENDCYIIPEGWWENRHYNPDDVYNNAVDDEVIAWRPMPEPYRGEQLKQTNADRIRNMTDEELLDFICSIETYEQGSVKTIEGGVAMCSVTDVEQWLKAESEEAEAKLKGVEEKESKDVSAWKNHIMNRFMREE